MVKSELALDVTRLQVPSDITAPNLRQAGLAWLDMAAALFKLEPFSSLKLYWWRNIDGTGHKLVISLDSAKNYATKSVRTRLGAPTDVPKRREMLDAAVAELVTKTTPEDLWAALAQQKLQEIWCWDVVRAWDRVSPGNDKVFPNLIDGHTLLVHMLPDMRPARSIHPWL